MYLKKAVQIEGRSIEFEFNKFAKQANAAVMVSSGGTQVLVTVCAAEKVNTDTRDRKSTRLNSSHSDRSRMPSSA